MDKKQVAEILEEIGTLLELKGENPFKVRAYQNAARTLQSLTEDLGKLVEEGRLGELKGIGEALVEKITTLVETGSLPYYEELRTSIPDALLAMLQIPGLGPKRVRAIHDQLGVKTLEDLEKSCAQNRIAGLEGFGEKTQRKIWEGIQYVKKNLGSFLLSDAKEQAREVLAFLQGLPSVGRVELAGSLRRSKEIIRDIDIVASTDRPVEVMKAFVAMEDVASILGEGDTKSSVRLESGIQVDLRAVSEEQFASALAYFTGSKEHNTRMRSRAKDQSLKLNEYGLFRGEERLSSKTEEELYKRLGLSYIPPELREDMGELEAAEKGTLPELISEKALRGVFHNHTTYSDGTASLEEMVRAAEEAGFQYIGISDHSPSAAYANGLKEADLQRQQREIDRVNSRKQNFRVFKGTECDILPDGSLDYPEEILRRFDFVIGSVHSNFTMNEEEMTARIVKALGNPYLTMLGHPTGRLLLARPGYRVNLAVVIEEAARLGKVIELNANPRRFDLDWRFCKTAKERGLKLSINPDAHSTEAVRDAFLGVGIARKGWLGPADVINTMNLKEITGWLERRKAR